MAEGAYSEDTKTQEPAMPVQSEKIPTTMTEALAKMAHGAETRPHAAVVTSIPLTAPAANSNPGTAANTANGHASPNGRHSVDGNGDRKQTRKDYEDWLQDSEQDEYEAPDLRLVYTDDGLQAATLTRLNTLRKGGQFCDVFLEVGGREVAGHRAVLACASVYLFELFSLEDQGASCPAHFKLEGFEYDSFDILVEYAYTAKLEVPEEKVKAVYRTAMMLKMESAAEACSRYLAEHLTPTNCLATRAFANSHSDLQLTEQTDTFIQSNMANGISDSAELKNLPRIQLNILGVEESDVGGENKRNLCKLVVRWVAENYSKEEINDLCDNLRVLYLTSDNTLRDCNDASDELFTGSNIVQDYKNKDRHRKKFQTTNVGAVPSGSRLPPTMVVIGTTARRPATPEATPKWEMTSDEVRGPGQKKERKEKHAWEKRGGGKWAQLETKPLADQEWKLISLQAVGNKSCLCVAILGDTLARMSLNFLPMPQNMSKESSPQSSPPSNISPRGSIAAEKQCSLTPLARMSSGRCGVGAATLDGLLVALGGYNRGECLNTVEAFDITQNCWRPLEPMLTPRGRFDATQIDGKLFACGGSDGVAELRSAEMYEDGKWNQLPSMQKPRSSAGVAMLNNIIYVVGGWSGQCGLQHCESYDPSQPDKWSVIAPLNTGRSQAGVCGINGKLVVVGGCQAWSCLNTAEEYDPTTDTWSYLPSMTSCRRGAGVAVFRDKLYVVGGSDGTTALATVEVFDPETGMWSIGPQMSVPRANVGVVVKDNRLFAVGGFSGKEFLDTVEYLNESSSEWCSFLPVESR